MTALMQKLTIGLVAIVAFITSLVGIPKGQPSPKSTPPPTLVQISPQPSGISLSFFTLKTRYSLKEEIPVEIILQGNNLSLAAVQLRIKYHPNLKVVESRASALLSVFNYGPNKNLSAQNEFQLAAILKDSQKPFSLKGRAIFTKLTFKPIKTGKATIFLAKDTAVYQLGDSTNLIKELPTLGVEIIP